MCAEGNNWTQSEEPAGRWKINNEEVCGVIRHQIWLVLSNQEDEISELCTNENREKCVQKNRWIVSTHHLGNNVGL
jgi:hypothetical protein